MRATPLVCALPASITSPSRIRTMRLVATVDSVIAKVAVAEHPSLPQIFLLKIHIYLHVLYGQKYFPF